ncbi:MAG: Gfo/Idh/MocA family oxidoreductase [Candidatus Omnitrophota bacterium]
MRQLRIAVIGGGMFFKEIIGQTLKDFERGGFAGALTSIGMSHYAPLVADIQCRFIAIGTHSAVLGNVDGIVQWFKEDFPASALRAHYRENVWEEMLDVYQPDILFVATPDHLHYAPIIAALERGVHVITEKPVCLKTAEIDRIIALARRQKRIVAADMHKRYDPFVRDLMSHAKEKYDQIDRVRACLEEPIDVSTEVFKWAEQSNPFTYVGCHWLDVVAYYLDVFPASLFAVGQKKLLANWGRYHRLSAEKEKRPLESYSKPHDINAWDALSVGITYADGMYGEYHNNWINPRDFEGAVNQEIEVYGTLGRGMVDQQDRGYREAIMGEGSRTRNPAFGGRIQNRGGYTEIFGYGKASIVAGILAIARAKFFGDDPEELKNTYPNVESQRNVIMIIEAAAETARRNFDYHAAGKGCPVTARFEEDLIAIVDPYRTPVEDILYRRSEE